MYPLSYQEIVEFFHSYVLQVIVPQSKAHFLRWFPKIGWKDNENSYVSGQF